MLATSHSAGDPTGLAGGMVPLAQQTQPTATPMQPPDITPQAAQQQAQPVMISQQTIVQQQQTGMEPHTTTVQQQHQMEVHAAMLQQKHANAAQQPQLTAEERPLPRR